MEMKPTIDEILPLSIAKRPRPGSKYPAMAMNTSKSSKSAMGHRQKGLDFLVEGLYELN